MKTTKVIRNTVERRAERAFGVQNPEEEYNQRSAVRSAEAERRYDAAAQHRDDFYFSVALSQELRDKKPKTEADEKECHELECLPNPDSEDGTSIADRLEREYHAERLENIRSLTVSELPVTNSLIGSAKLFQVGDKVKAPKHRPGRVGKITSINEFEQVAVQFEGNTESEWFYPAQLLQVQN